MPPRYRLFTRSLFGVLYFIPNVVLPVTEDPAVCGNVFKGRNNPITGSQDQESPEEAPGTQHPVVKRALFQNWSGNKEANWRSMKLWPPLFGFPSS
jgi:hypothetical protein